MDEERSEEKKRAPSQTYEHKKEMIKDYQSRKAQISLTVDKSEKARWKEGAAKKKVSLSRFITDVVNEYCSENGL